MKPFILPVIFAVLSLLLSSCSKTQNNALASGARDNITSVGIQPLPPGVTAVNPIVAPAGPTAAGIVKGMIAIHSIEIDQMNTIDSDIAVIGTCAGATCLSDGAELTIDQQNRLGATNTVKADSIVVKQKAVVPSRLEANHFQVSSRATAPDQNPLGVLPELPPFLEGTPGTVNVAASATPLVAGNYAKLILNQNQSLVLAGGVYHFTAVDIGQKTSLTCAASASCLVLVKGRVDVGQKAVVRAAADANDLAFFVEGKGCGHGASVALGQKVGVLANFYAPNGLIDIGQQSDVTGILIGKWIKIAQQSRVTGITAPNPPPPAPTVVTAAPAEGDTNVALNTPIAVTFSLPMNAATLTASTTTACTGSVQVSTDGFANCVVMTSASAVMSGSDTVATFTPATLAGNTKYRIRVTTAAQAANTAFLAADYTQGTEWQTAAGGGVPSVGQNIYPGCPGFYYSAIAAEGDYAALACGLVYAIKKDNAGQWLITQTLTPGAVTVSISNEYLAGSANGYVQIWKRDASGLYVPTFSIANPEADTGNLFGKNVILRGDTLVVSAEMAYVSGIRAGSVFIYRKSGEDWTLHSRLDNIFTFSVAQFGSDLGLEGDDLAVGAQGYSSVFLFKRDSAGVWNFSSQLMGPSLSSTFGISVSMSGDTLVVGAYTARPQNPPYSGPGVPGAAYVYTRDSSGVWQYTQELYFPDAIPGALYGQSVSVKNDMIVVGAPGMGPVAFSSTFGYTYVYKRVGATWGLVNTINPPVLAADDPNGRTADLLGQAVATNGVDVFSGAVGIVHLGVQQAVVHVEVP